MTILLAAVLLLQDDEVARLIEKLGSEQIEEREAAEKKLVELGEKAEPALRKAAESPTAEVASRAKVALRKIEHARAAAKKFQFSAWESWDAFGEGTKVELEYEVTAGGLKMRQTKTLARKAAEVITLDVELAMNFGGNDVRTPSQEQVKEMPAAADCLLCEKSAKEHKDEGEWGAETLKVGDREILCTTYQSAGLTCMGQPVPRMKMWYSREVPGHMVKMTSDQITVTVVSFEAKPKEKKEPKK